MVTDDSYAYSSEHFVMYIISNNYVVYLKPI